MGRVIILACSDCVLMFVKVKSPSVMVFLRCDVLRYFCDASDLRCPELYDFTLSQLQSQDERMVIQQHIVI